MDGDNANMGPQGMNMGEANMTKLREYWAILGTIFTKWQAAINEKLGKKTFFGFGKDPKYAAIEPTVNEIVTNLRNILEAPLDETTSKAMMEDYKEKIKRIKGDIGHLATVTKDKYPGIYHLCVLYYDGSSPQKYRLNSSSIKSEDKNVAFRYLIDYAQDSASFDFISEQQFYDTCIPNLNADGTEKQRGGKRMRRKMTMHRRKMTRHRRNPTRRRKHTTRR
jgi:hypothetical protein